MLLVNYHSPKKNEWDEVALILKQFHTEKLFKTMKETSQEIQAAIMAKEQNNLWHEYYHPSSSPYYENNLNELSLCEVDITKID